MNQTEIVLEKKIGSGSFGDVFSGHLKSTGEKIAVKRVKKKIIMQYGEYLINAFYKEINSMKLCACENSVKLIQNLETENNFNIVMELCDTDLLCHLNKSSIPFSTDEVRDTFLQLNNVFRIMHKNNIIHRDLKLGNILIKYTDKSHKKFIPKLSDYGFSKDLNSNNYTATHLGTPATMAPEIMMNLPYNEKSDIWSIGAMMYQLHFKEIPYPGFSEQQILRKIQSNTPRKQPSDPQLRDLLNKIFVLDPQKRISWDDYFNHPFFKVEKDKNNQKNESQYEKISDLDLEYNYNIKEKDLFKCYIAKDKRSGKNVLVKSYREDFMEKNNQLFGEEIALFKAFKGNPSILNLINITKENKRFNMIFEYVNAHFLIKYCKNEEIREKHIKKFNKILYNEIFVFNECNFLPFIFLSMHNFLVYKDFKPIIFDFGIHKLLLPQEEYSSYFLPDKSQMNCINQNRIKTNVLTYGVTLLKLFSGNNLQIKGKEIILPENKIMSEDFNDFLSKCLTRNTRKRYSWLQLGSCNFVLDDVLEFSNIVGNDALINDEKLKQIFVYLNNKFELIINYYNDINFMNNEYISQIEIFINVTLFEMKIVNAFFNRDIYKKPFTNQNEISFISIDTNCEMKKFDLNFVNPVLREFNIVKMNNNKIINDFLPLLQKNIKKMEKLSLAIRSFTKESCCSEDISNFIQQIINSVYNIDTKSMQQYFIKLINKAVKEKNKEVRYNELNLAKYLIELILFVINIVNDNEKKIQFQKDILLKKFYQIFGESKNKVEISTINNKNAKYQHYLIVSFLPVLFKCKEASFLGKIKFSKDKQSINKLIQYYPSLMKQINEIKNS